jgi:YVTN family beta-propeller protein
MVGSENPFDVVGLTPEQRLRLAADPGTAPSLLQSLAQYYPPTRVVVAGNPAAYPALLQWLAGLGDPAVSAAVAARLHSPAPPPPPPVAGFTPTAAPVASGPGPVAPVALTDVDGPTLSAPGGQPVMVAPKAKRRRLLVWVGVVAAVVVVALVGVVVFRTVTVSHPATHVAATITVGKNPAGLAVARDGSVYVANYGDKTVSVIKGDRVTTTINVGTSPVGAAVASDGTLYVANYGDGTVSVIKGDLLTTTITVGKNPVGAAFGSDGTLYVANYGDGTVSVLR